MRSKNTQQLIEGVLANSNRARQDDKYLQLRIWHEQGLVLTEDQRTLFLSKSISAPESIRRLRQKLQEQGKFRPVEEVYQYRQDKAEYIRQSIHNAAEPLRLFES